MPRRDFLFDSRQRPPSHPQGRRLTPRCAFDPRCLIEARTDNPDYPRTISRDGTFGVGSSVLDSRPTGTVGVPSIKVRRFDIGPRPTQLPGDLRRRAPEPWNRGEHGLRGVSSPVEGIVAVPEHVPLWNDVLARVAGGFAKPGVRAGIRGRLGQQRDLEHLGLHAAFPGETRATEPHAQKMSLEQERAMPGYAANGPPIALHLAETERVGRLGRDKGDEYEREQGPRVHTYKSPDGTGYAKDGRILREGDSDGVADALVLTAQSKITVRPPKSNNVRPAAINPRNPTLNLPRNGKCRVEKTPQPRTFSTTRLPAFDQPPLTGQEAPRICRTQGLLSPKSLGIETPLEKREE